MIAITFRSNVTSPRNADAAQYPSSKNGEDVNEDDEGDGDGDDVNEDDEGDGDGDDVDNDFDDDDGDDDDDVVEGDRRRLLLLSFTTAATVSGGTPCRPAIPKDTKTLSLYLLEDE